MTTHSSRRINTIAERFGAKNYLEIGVAQGDTFRSVTIPHKTAVDPHFDFDWRSLESKDQVLLQITSDEFFCEHARGAFDVIFIDGMHVYEQVFRDFVNSLMFSHDRTVWVLDDTVPSDPYSAWPNDREAITLRRGAGITDSSWHGDVFKLVFLIDNFFPMFSYATIMTDGNPQTLVWRSPRKKFVPVNDSLEAISRLQYMDFMMGFARMNPCSEAEALEKLFSAFEGLGAA